MIGSSYLFLNHPNKINKIINKRKEIVNLWVEFYNDEMFQKRQNSSTLFNSQHEWEKRLEKWINKNFVESDIEIAIKLLRNMNPSMRKNGIEKLKNKKYYNKVLDIARFERWIE